MKPPKFTEPQKLYYPKGVDLTPGEQFEREQEYNRFREIHYEENDREFDYKMEDYE